MRTFTRTRGALGAVAVGAVVLVASAAIPAGASTTGVYNAAAAKLVPAQYKGKTILVATDASYAPDEFIKNGKIVGFDVDLINAIGKTLGLKMSTSNVTFNTIIAGLQSGKYAIGNSSFTDSKKREKSVNFVDYFVAGEGAYVKSTTHITFSGLSSFCGHSVAVESGTVEESDAKAQAKKCPSGQSVTVRSFPTQTEANVAVSSGQATFGFADSQISAYIAATSKGVFKVVGKALNVAPYGIATAKTPAGLQLAKAIQAALKVLIANGTYGSILKAYGVQAGGLAASKIVLNGATS
jgi:polar amino acid transport system substrate-binding protein